MPPWDPLVISPCKALGARHGACCERTIQFSRTEGARPLAYRTGAVKVVYVHHIVKHSFRNSYRPLPMTGRSAPTTHRWGAGATLEACAQTTPATRPTQVQRCPRLGGQGTGATSKRTPNKLADGWNAIRRLGGAEYSRRRPCQRGILLPLLGRHRSCPQGRELDP